MKVLYSTGRDVLEDFGKAWNEKYPMIYQSWQRHWDDLSGFYKYPAEIRRAIYTTNAIESLNFSLRKVIKNKLIIVNDDAIIKILYLAIRNVSEKWTMPIKNWGQAAYHRYETSLPLSLEKNGFRSYDIFHLHVQNQIGSRQAFFEPFINQPLKRSIAGVF